MGAWSASAARRAGETLERPPQTAGEPTSRLIEAEANRLVATYADTILRVSYTYLHNTQDAEDICQEVLLKALGRTKGFDSAEHERAWIIRVAINAAKDLLKRQTGRDTVALDEISEPAAPRRATEHELEARAEGVLERVMALPLEYREAIYLHYYEGYSIKQIAAIVHASESAVATRLSRGGPNFAPPWKEFDMSSTFDSISYRSDLDQLSFTGEQKARMTARLIEAANAVPIGIPTTHETAPSTSAEDTGEAAPAEILELPVDRADQPSRIATGRRQAHPFARCSKVRRIAAALGIAALLTVGGGTAYATGTLARAADSLAAVFGAGPAQTELIDRIGRPIGASCTSNGITITADAIIGMRHAYAVVYTIEKDDGTAFDEITMNENGHYNLFLEGGGNINALTALRLGVQGGHGGAYTFDADPSDNAIQLMEMMSLTGTDASLSGETLHFDAIKLLYMPTSADGQRDLPVETIATGDWNMSFKIDYDDLSVDLPAGQSFTVNGHNAVVDELAISPLGATITYTVDAVDGPSEPTGLETNSESRAGYGNFSVTFTDGTTEEIGSGYGSWREDGKTVVQKTRLFDQIRDVDDIASITVGDLTVPIQ